MNEALPWMLSFFCLIGVFTAWCRRNQLFSLIALTLPVTYASTALAGLLIFPISATRDLRGFFEPSWLFGLLAFGYGFWLPLFLTAMVFGLLAGVTFWHDRITPIILGLATAVGTCLGAVFIWTQRANDPTTCPVSHTPLLVPRSSAPVEVNRLLLGADVSYDAQEGTVKMRHAGVGISVRSILVLPNVSLDRCWTLFAPRDAAKRYKMHFVSAFSDQNAKYFDYRGGTQALVRIARSPGDEEQVEIETWTYLPEDVFSHLNSFAEVCISNYSNLSISLSPFPKERFALRPHSHPVGWIDQGFAFMDARGGFHWARGTHEEKGPFEYLADGRLERGDPVILTIFNENRAICRITLRDWSEQASIALSPTAGWRVPANAVTASVGPASSGNLASIDFSLAATHIGSGSETVGHKAGAYRNRITISLLNPKPDSTNEQF